MDPIHNIMTHTSRIELSRSALVRNLAFIRSQTGPAAHLYSVLKGNAYGHGIELMARMLADAGTRRFAVFDAVEALRIHRVVEPEREILVMGFMDRHEIEWAIENDIQFYVFDVPRLEEAIAAAKSVGRTAQVHIEVETGLHRTGLAEAELPRALDLLVGNGEHVRLAGLCTHFAGAENVSNHDRIRRQFEIYHERLNYCVSRGVVPGARHTACSAAVVAYPDTILDMVRVGILHYGFWPSRETQLHYLARNPTDRNPLRRVISWRSRVIAVKEVPTGEYIGYGTTFLTEQPTRIAVVPVGYAYGYARSLSNLGRVLIRGRRLPVVGIVNMNMITVNLAEAPDVETGDEVVLIGRQGNNSISVASFSEMSSQLNYEMLTRLPMSIPRTIVP